MDLIFDLLICAGAFIENNVGTLEYELSGATTDF